jgi:hypothetical protein
MLAARKEKSRPGGWEETLQMNSYVLRILCDGHLGQDRDHWESFGRILGAGTRRDNIQPAEVSPFALETIYFMRLSGSLLFHS